MKSQQTLFEIFNPKRGIYSITEQITDIATSTTVKTGICHVFLPHTSASLIFCENADATVRRDLEAFMNRLIPDGDPLFKHTAEGPDDMPAHVRTVLTQNSLAIPVTEGKLLLGTWQGIYLWEHRTEPHRRQIIVTVMGAESI